MGRSKSDLETETRSSDIEGAAWTARVRVPGLAVLCHPDPRRVGEEAALYGLTSGEAARLSRIEPEFAQPADDGSFRPLAEPHLSRQPLLLRHGNEPGSLVLDRADSRTPITVDGVPVDDRRVFSAAEIERGVVLVLSRRVALLLHPVDPVPPSLPYSGLVGESEGMVRVRQDILTAARLDATVLLRGETGTGKELVARALHDASGRRGRFVTVNMAALPPSLAASELFGAVRGAYTGADRKKTGFFESAEGGTLFLDEIGEVPTEVQAMLLRTLENREIQPVGSVETRRVDVRVIAATDSDLEAAISSGLFRAPLLHRLEGFEICLPPLRERRGDIARLLYHFLRKGLEAGGPGQARETDERPWPPAELVARLVGFDWPGNVRQLKNVARRLALVSGTAQEEKAEELVERLLGTADRGAGPAAAPPLTGGAGEPASRRFRKISEVGEKELRGVLKAHRWHLQPAASALGISRATLYRLIDRSPRLRKAAELESDEIVAVLERHGGDPQAAAAELEVSPQGLRRRIKALGLGG